MTMSWAKTGGPVLDRADLGQIVLVLQGGGALGAYQAGVYQALDEAGVEPDWVIGTSIGAINAGIIAGNRPEDRLPRLRAFWDRVRHGPAAQLLAGVPGWGALAANALTVAGGVPGFFTPNFYQRHAVLVPRDEVLLPEVEDLVRAFEHCTETTCRSEDREFRFGFKRRGGELVLARLEVTELAPCATRTP